MNSILFFIGATSLTDEEFATVTSTVTIYDQSTYDDLANILKGRESVSTYVDRLTFYYKAAGVEVQPSSLSTSNVFLGSVL